MNMKAKKILFYMMAMVVAASCDMSPEIDLSMTLEDVTTTYNNTMARAAAVYTYLPDGFAYIGGDAMLASACDEAEHTNEGNAVQAFNTGSWSYLNNPDGAWARCFKGIYAANLFLENSDAVNLDYLKYDSSSDAQAKYVLYTANLRRCKFEVRFLRALYYFELVERYGGVPIMEEAYDVESDYTSIPRNSLAECFDFIVKECDAVADSLPVTYESGDIGRATKGAALALKSRALLFKASDLFNDPSWADGFDSPELISIVGGDRKVQWDEAAKAAKAVIDLTDARYALLTNYDDIFLNAYNSNETIFCRRYGSSTSFETANYSIGFDNGNSGTTPSENLVSKFETASGEQFDWETMGLDPYSNRDPRLGYSILTNNSTFKSRTMEIYEGGRDGKGIVNATKTGYYLRKYVDPNVDLINGRGTVHAWIIFRLAEMYLNYAEAMNEAYGPNDDNGYGLTAVDAVNKIRQRKSVDMPAVSSDITQDELREKIRNERAVELCFEGHRMFDVRRWMIAEDVLNEPLMGVSATRESRNFLYSVVKVEDRSFSKKMYLYPIPQTDLKISGWTQNPLW